MEDINLIDDESITSKESCSLINYVFKYFEDNDNIGDFELIPLKIIHKDDVFLFYDSQYSIRAMFAKEFLMSNEDLINKKIKVESFDLDILGYIGSYDTLERKIVMLVKSYSFVYSPDNTELTLDINENLKIKDLSFIYFNRKYFIDHKQIEDVSKITKFEIKAFLKKDQNGYFINNLISNQYLESFTNDFTKNHQVIENISISENDLKELFKAKNGIFEILSIEEEIKEDMVNLDNTINVINKDDDHLLNKKRENEVPLEILNLSKTIQAKDISMLTYEKYLFNKILSVWNRQ